ncbi:RecQ family ATP-dependent DNA helicase [Brevibacillus fluminis]|nr:RecQ family ATP-dependent DNA helicase [Brevibacillus fluminis]
MMDEVHERRLTEILRQSFGHSTFRPGQLEIIGGVLSGRNTLGVLPTGGGKSVLYQLLSLTLPHMTVVISPLVSLMIDQVQRLKQNGKQYAVYLNSTCDAAEMKQTLQEIRGGKYKLLYLSPEKLQQPYVRAMLKARGVSLFAVDEAHCIAQWGHDFRTDYMRLPTIVEQLGSPPVLAVTATATMDAQREIAELFSIHPDNRIVQSMNRPNIAFERVTVENEAQKRELLLDDLRKLTGPGIVYCSTRQAVETLVLQCRLSGIDRVHGYHGGMNGLDRMLVQEQFLRGELDVIVATNAFGMGIDKPDIRYVLHYHAPASLEAYVQEVGRVGRDGQPGYARLYMLEEDVHIHYHMLGAEYPEENRISQVLTWLGAHQRESIGLQELAEGFDLSENQAELIFFYAEQCGLLDGLAPNRAGFLFKMRKTVTPETVRQISRLIQNAKWSKLHKLQQMTEWLSSQQCLRQGLLRYFDEDGQQEGTLPCCSICGVDRIAYESVREPLQAKVVRPWDMKEALRLLLPVYPPGKEEGNVT